MREPLSDLEKLQFYRDEVKHEFNLLAMRSNILVTCQSFLVVPFAILNTAGNFRMVFWAALLVAGLGIYISLLIKEPIEAAHRTIGKWLLKQRSMLKGEHLQELRIDRDEIEGVESDLAKDKEHERGLSFSKSAPRVFINFWILAIVGTLIRVIIGG